MDFLHRVEAVIILDNDGRRIYSNYYPIPDLSTGEGKGKDAQQAAHQAQATSVSISSNNGPWGSPEKQRHLEKALHQKSIDSKSTDATTGDGDVFLHDGHTVVYKVDPELSYFVLGGGNENELVLYSVLMCLYDSLQTVLKLHGCIDKRSLLEHYDALLLVVDELIDDAVILETSSTAIASNVQPYVTQNDAADGARKALASVNKFIKHNL